MTNATSTTTQPEEILELQSSQGPQRMDLVDAQLLKDLKNIPNQMAFRIGDVADLVGIKQYVLRYWETEFDTLHPKKSTHNQRMYSKKDVEAAFYIKKLLYRDRFSIEGAKRVLREIRSQVKKEKQIIEVSQKCLSVQTELGEILDELTSLRRLFA